MSGEAQMELGIDVNPGTASAVPVDFPPFTLTVESRPIDIVVWWDDLVAVFTAEAAAAVEKAKPIEAELATLKRPSGLARARRAFLLQERDALFAQAEGAEFDAYGLFEGTLSEFSPTLIGLLQAGGLDIPDDDEMAVAEFWDYLQRPLIEHFAETPIRELVRDFCGFKDYIAAQPEPGK